MKVCHIYPTLLLNEGPSNVLFALLPDLVRLGVKNVVVSLRAAPAGRDARSTVESSGARYVEFAMSDSMLDVSVLPPLIRFLRQENFDVLQCNLLRASLYGRLAAYCSGGVPVLSVVHNIEQYLTGKSLTSRAVRFVERHTAGAISRHVAVSRAVAEILQTALDIDPETIEVIHNGVPKRPPDLSRAPARRKFQFPERAVVVGSVGRLHPQKLYAHLLLAVAEVRKHCPDLHLVLVGDGPERQKLEKLSRDLGVDQIVQFTGHLTDVSEILPAFDIFTLVSAHEGLPMALLEAMQVGLPSIVTRAGGMPEAVAHGISGFVLEVGDIPGIALALQKLVENRPLRRKMGEQAKLFLNLDFTADRAADKYQKLYRLLSSERTG